MESVWSSQTPLLTTSPSPTHQPTPSPLATTTLLSMSTHLVWFGLFICFLILFFNIPQYAWSHMLFVFLCLIYFTWHNSLKVHPCSLKGQDFTFLWLNNIPVYLWISHIFIHSSINRHEGCFHNTKMNIGVIYHFCFFSKVCKVFIPSSRGQEEKGLTEDEMAGWHHRLDGREFGWTPGVGDGQGGLACCDSWGRKESDTAERLNWTELNVLIPSSNFLEVPPF